MRLLRRIPSYTGRSPHRTASARSGGLVPSGAIGIRSVCRTPRTVTQQPSGVRPQRRGSPSCTSTWRSSGWSGWNRSRTAGSLCQGALDIGRMILRRRSCRLERPICGAERQPGRRCWLDYDRPVRFDRGVTLKSFCAGIDTSSAASWRRCGRGPTRVSATTSAWRPTVRASTARMDISASGPLQDSGRRFPLLAAAVPVAPWTGGVRTCRGEAAAGADVGGCVALAHLSFDAGREFGEAGRRQRARGADREDRLE